MELLRPLCPRTKSHRRSKLPLPMQRDLKQQHRFCPAPECIDNLQSLPFIPRPHTLEHLFEYPNQSICRSPLRISGSRGNLSSRRKYNASSSRLNRRRDMNVADSKILAILSPCNKRETIHSFTSHSKAARRV